LLGTWRDGKQISGRGGNICVPVDSVSAAAAVSVDDILISAFEAGSDKLGRGGNLPCDVYGLPLVSSNGVVPLGRLSCGCNVGDNLVCKTLLLCVSILSSMMSSVESARCAYWTHLERTKLADDSEVIKHGEWNSQKRVV